MKIFQYALFAFFANAAYGQPTQLFFGDTHVHTSYSEEAYALGRNVSGDPDTAYRWAKGLPVVHPYTGVKIQSARPLDFLVVADHAFYLGIYKNVMDGRPGFLLPACTSNTDATSFTL